MSSWKHLLPRRVLRDRLALLLAGIVLAAGCGVPRAAPPVGLLPDDSTLPNLRRGQEALRDRIALEKEHVEALNLQLAGLRGDEEQLYKTYLAAEADYQLRAQDLAGVESDIAAVRQQLDDARVLLGVSQQELAQLQADLATTTVEVVSLRQQLDAAHALRDVLSTQLASEGLAGDAAAPATIGPNDEPPPEAGSGVAPGSEVAPDPVPDAEPDPEAGEVPAEEPEPAPPSEPSTGGGGGSNA